jgi:transcriptional regulator with XRE-family HTH domain
MASVLKEFGSKVHRYRLKKHLSQEKLAELANIHRTYIGQVESGKRNIALKNIEKIAKALSVPIKKLF